MYSSHPSSNQFYQTSNLQRKFLYSDLRYCLLKVKFGVIPRAEALSCLRQLVYDFRGHSIDMVCAMIETAGFYLYRYFDVLFASSKCLFQNHLLTAV